MRRFLLALAVLLTVTATPTLAGYIIVRVLLAGTGGGDAAPGGPGNYGPPPSSATGLGGRGSPGGGSGEGGGGRGGPGPGVIGPPPSAMGGSGSGGSPARPADFDHTRSIVVAIPLELQASRRRELPEEKLFPKLNLFGMPDEVVKEYSQKYGQLDFEYRGRKLNSPLYFDSSSIQVYDELLGVPGQLRHHGTEIREKYNAWVAKKDNPQLLYDALVLALQHGYVPQAVTYAQELLAVAKAKKTALPEAAARFATAWGTMSKEALGGTEQSADAEAWKLKLTRYLRPATVYHQGHYTLITGDNTKGAIDPKTNSVDLLGGEVDRRLAQLNENFQAYFLWHATRGIVLPVPDKALLVVLPPDTARVSELREALDGLPGADGFYAPEHDLLVLSPGRLDDVGRTFLAQNKQVFKGGLVREQLLTKQYPAPDRKSATNVRPNDIAYAATLAAVELLMKEEFEMAAVSREGTRQLLYATGVLPRHVALPSWLANGAVNFFARPRGPAYVTDGDEDKPFMHVALSTGYGTTNYVLHRYFRDLQKKDELPTDAAKLLSNVLTDAYFNGIKNGEDPDPAPNRRVVRRPNPNPNPNPMITGQPPMGIPAAGVAPAGDSGGSGTAIGGTALGGSAAIGSIGANSEDPAALLRNRKQRLQIKANATSWALYYYLAREKPEELKAYVAELDRLPRDLPIDGRTAMEVFVRAFNLSSAPDGAVDPKRLKEFADEWLRSMKTVAVVGHDVALVVPKVLPATSGVGGAPPGGMVPGRGGDN